jgi:Ca-activated chloride channel family protein
MFSGTSHILRLLVRTLGLPLLVSAFSVAGLAQSPDDPMGLPPRTSQPPASVQAPAEQSPNGESNGQSITPDSSITPDEDQGRFVFKRQVQEVVLHATVVDETGRLVTSLDRSAFLVFQNGQPETISSFRREDVPVALGIVVDNSGSMRDKRGKVNQAVLNLVRASNQQDQVFVVNFGQTPYLDQDFTSDVNLLQAALHQVSSRGSTALYDAVVASNTHLRSHPILDKRVLLVITDGQDNMSRETLQDAMRKLQSSKGATLYAIGLTDQGQTMSKSGRDALKELAASTGGVAFFPQTLDEVDEITREIAHDVRSQYTITYNPGAKIGTGYQTIRVEAKGPGRSHFTVRTRNGYYPGEAMK